MNNIGHNRDVDRIHPGEHNTGKQNELFRGMPGFPDGMSVNSHDDLMPMDTNQFAKVTEYAIVALCSILALWLLYWVGKAYTRRRKSKKDVRQILSINNTYKELVEREETLQQDLMSVTDQYRSV